MKTILLALGGFLLGFAAVSAWRNEGRISTPEPAPAANQELRKVEVPPDFLDSISARLVAARASGPDGAEMRVLQREVDRWMLADPIGCVEFLHRNGAIGLVRIDHLPAVFAGAFRGNLALAIREAMHLPDARLRFAWLNAVFDEAAQTSPEQALELLAYVPRDRRAVIGDKLMKHYAEKDPAAAWRAVAGSRSSAYQHGHLWRQDEFMWGNVVLDVWGERDSKGLAAFLKSKLVAARGDWEGRILVNALDGFSQRRHARELLSVLAGMERNRAVEKLWRQALATVARKDPDLALQIARAEPQAVARDRSTVVVAETVGAKDREQALRVLQAVSAEPARTAAVRSILANWAGADPVSAAQGAGKIEHLLSRAEAMREVAGVWYTLHQSGKLPELALEAGIPEAGPSWLGIIAEMLRTSGDNGGNWGRELDAATREQFEAEMRRRMTAEEWTRVESIFRPYRPRK